MKRYKSQLKEDAISGFRDAFSNLFKRYSPKEAAGVVKIALVDSVPDEEYLKKFMNILG